MRIGSMFENNITQAVRIPVDYRFPATVKKVAVRKVGKERILTPIENTWDSFFLSDELIDDDFLNERANQDQPRRESFDD
ncbi:MAG: AbrB/MazE/SpoVT family DNA-binding domain-containing protein [Leptonema sp. (in: Bacteria)]|nr:AbrB/MazE/SpoVT family DNA-binding domain-containing protein [Leptonema sp. (in: bacteria)]